MATKHTFPAKVRIFIGNPTAAFMFSVYANDEGISERKELDVPGGALYPFMAYEAVITEAWYRKHRKHRAIEIEFIESK